MSSAVFDWSPCSKICPSTSGNVPKLRMTVAERPLLLLTRAIKSVIALAVSPCAILADAVYDTERSEYDNADLCHQIDRVADRIAWCIGK